MARPGAITTEVPSSVWDIPPPDITASERRPRLTKQEKKLQKKYPPPFPKAASETWLEREYAKFRCPKCNASIMRSDVIACGSCGAALRQYCDDAPTQLRSKRTPTGVDQQHPYQRKTFEALLSSSGEEDAPVDKPPPGFAEAGSELTSTVATLTDKETVHQCWSEILGCHVSHIQAWSISVPPCKLVCDACGSLYDEFELGIRPQERVIQRIITFLNKKGPIPKLQCNGDCCGQDFLSRIDTVRTLKEVLDDLLLPPGNYKEPTSTPARVVANEGRSSSGLSSHQRQPHHFVDGNRDSTRTLETSSPAAVTLPTYYGQSRRTDAARDSTSAPLHPPGLPVPQTASPLPMVETQTAHSGNAAGSGRNRQKMETEAASDGYIDSDEDASIPEICWEEKAVPDVAVSCPAVSEPHRVEQDTLDEPRHEEYRSVISDAESLVSGSSLSRQSSVSDRPRRDPVRRRRSKQSSRVSREHQNYRDSEPRVRRNPRSESSSSESSSSYYRQRAQRRDDRHLSCFPHKSEPYSTSHLIDFLMHSRIIILCGPHLAGKSYLAELLRKHLGFTVFSPDHKRKEVDSYIRNHYYKSNTRKWEKIVIDRPNLRHADRLRWWEMISAASLPLHRIGLLCLWPGNKMLRRRYMNEYGYEAEEAWRAVERAMSEFQPVDYKREIKKENFLAVTSWDEVRRLQDVIEKLGRIIDCTDH